MLQYIFINFSMMHEPFAKIIGRMENRVDPDVGFPPPNSDFNCFQKILYPDSARHGLIHPIMLHLILQALDMRAYLIFLFLSQNICCWYSKELSQ